MTKKDLAELTLNAIHMESQVNMAIESSVDMIASQFTLLANLNPETALDVLSQLNAQAKDIETTMKDNAKIQSERIKLMAQGLPDSIELDEENQGEETIN